MSWRASSKCVINEIIRHIEQGPFCPRECSRYELVIGMGLFRLSFLMIIPSDYHSLKIKTENEHDSQRQS